MFATDVLKTTTVATCTGTKDQQIQLQERVSRWCTHDNRILGQLRPVIRAIIRGRAGHIYTVKH